MSAPRKQRRIQIDVVIDDLWCLIQNKATAIEPKDLIVEALYLAISVLPPKQRAELSAIYLPEKEPVDLIAHWAVIAEPMTCSPSETGDPS